MEIRLIQPNLDEKHENQRQAYGSANRPPETGLAVLSSWINAYSPNGHKIKVINPDKSIDDIINDTSNSGVLGITDWFSNHDNCISLARESKRVNPNLKVVFGGPNASMMPSLLLRNHPYIDFVVSRDGEDALLGLVDNNPIETIPNLWHRSDGGIKRTHQGYTDLKKMPLWDFSSHEDADARLKEYLQAQNSGLDPWLVPPVTLFSFRGCMKAIKEGVCSYCTSAEERGRALPPEKLWAQIKRLNKLYGAEIFYMGDDIFPISQRRVQQIADTKLEDARVRIRAYGYLPDMADLPTQDLEGMAKNLQRIGVFNLFFGSENYDSSILRRMNKRGTSIDETRRVVKSIYDAGGIKTTVAYVLGLPGETKETLETNLRTLSQLTSLDGNIERLYLSVGMPLIGTAWHTSLLQNQQLTEEYRNETGRNLAEDDSPNYNLLSKLSIRHTTSVTPAEINFYINKFIEVARSKMPDYRIGGFLLDLGE